MGPTLKRITSTMKILEEAGYPHTSLHRGAWSSEAEQRNYGQSLGRLVGATDILIVDADEFYEEAELRRILSLNERSRAARYSALVAAELDRLFSLLAPPPAPLTVTMRPPPPQLYSSPFLFAPMHTYEASAKMRRQQELGADSSSCSQVLRLPPARRRPPRETAGAFPRRPGL
jgi:hypothetical protein